MVYIRSPVEDGIMIISGKSEEDRAKYKQIQKLARGDNGCVDLFMKIFVSLATGILFGVSGVYQISLGIKIISIARVLHGEALAYIAFGCILLLLNFLILWSMWARGRKGDN